MDDDDEVPGRVRRRRPMGLSDSTVGDGVRDLNREVMDSGTGVDDYIQDQDTDAAEKRNDIRNKLNHVGRRHTNYEREYRLQMMHRLLMQGMPLTEIADIFGLSAGQIHYDRQELHARLREESRKLDIDLLVGDNVAFYDEVSAMALDASTQKRLPMNIRLAAMRTSLAAKNDGHRFLQAAGVYTALQYRRASDGKGQTDIQKMVELTERLLGEAEKTEDEDKVVPYIPFSNEDET